MATSKRCGVIVVILLTTGLLMGLFWQIAFVKASTVMDEPEPPLIGEPCGSGELLPDWVICLHGVVGVEQPGGQVQPQDGVTVTIAYGGEVVTGTTFVHPGKIIPTFGIDISPLEPAFLQPVTLTVVVDEVTITRQIVVFPDFNTQNQQFDVIVPIGVLAPQISGSVIDFAGGGAVAGAGVAVAHINQTVYLTTAVPISGEQPIFGVDPASFPGIQTGDTLTFTTTYNGDTDQQTIIYNDAEPVIVNLITGWKCDGFDPLPRTGPGSGLPRTGPGSGLPDVACFWGYVRLDGQPLAGVDVHITVSDTVYSGQTGAFTGEGLARYGIGLWGAGDLDGEMVTVTAVYNGKTVTETNIINLDAQLSQRTDLILAQPEGLANFISGNQVSDLLWHDGYLWAATRGGMFRWDPSNDTFTQFTTLDGLIDNAVQSLAVNPADGTFWFAGGGASHYVAGNDPEWQTFAAGGGNDLPDGNIPSIALETNGAVWFAADNVSTEVARYDLGTQTWQYYDTTDGLASNRVRAVALMSDDIVWFGTNDAGASRFNQALNQWTTFNTSDGLSSNVINEVAIDSGDTIWFATNNGVSHYVPVSDTWEVFTATQGGLLHNTVRTVTIDPNDNSVWFGTVEGVSHYSPSSDIWESWTESDGLIDNDISSITVENGGDRVWFGNSENGICQYTQNAAFDCTILATTGLPGNEVRNIAVAPNGDIWFTVGSQGVSRYSPGSIPEWESFNDINTVWFSVADIAASSEGLIWFADSAALDYYNPYTDVWDKFFHDDLNLPSLTPEVISADQDGTLWIAHDDTSILHFSPISTTTEITATWESFTNVPGIDFSNVTVITPDLDNDLIWIGTNGQGVITYAPATNTWQSITHSSTGGGLSQDSITDIALDLDGSVWFGTVSGGLCHYDFETGWDTPITASPGELLNNHVSTIEVNVDGSLWLGTGSSGANHYTPGGNPDWEVWTQADGLADNSVLSIETGLDGTLWFGTSNGVSQWHDPGQNSDLSLQVETQEGVFPDEILTTTAVLENVGQRDALHTVVTATLPASVTFQSASPSPDSTNPLVWQLGTLPDEDPPVSIVITGTVEATAVPHTILPITLETATTSPEAYFTNNSAAATTIVRDPFHVDLRTTLTGPPQFQPEAEVEFLLFADNFGGVPAENTTLELQLPSELSYVSASIPPENESSVTWELGALDPQAAPFSVTVSALVDSDVAQTTLTTTATISNDIADSNPANNISTVAIPTTLDSALTLILAAPTRLANRYGASPVMDKVYTLAQHPAVQGVVVDVMADTAVADAYTAWDADPGSWQKANEVAEEIKALIDSYTIAYPNLEYLQIIGGDDIIPFYRIDDQNSTMWHEQLYASYVPPGTTVQAALNADRLLTDDYYADRTPTALNSPFWYDSHELYLPDFAIGRLVETPDEISTAVDSFLANNGQINIDTNLVGYLSTLTNDWGLEQCTLLQSAGHTATCTDDKEEYAQFAVEQSFGGLWSAVHANHFNTGLLSSSQLQNSSTDYSQSLMSTIGCHAGLNVAPGSSETTYPHLDMAQAFLGQGGAFIGSTGYAYGSELSVGYSEALLQRFTTELLADNNRAVGAALLDAKHGYYAEHSGWFDYNDEKVSVALTLYGFPMLEITPPPASRNLVEKSSLAQIVTSPAFQSTGVVTYTYAGLTVTEHDLGSAGIYYDQQGQSLAQEMLPLQPLLPESVPTDVIGQTVRGMVLRQASYTSIDSFDPVINQSFAMGAEVDLPAEPPITFTGWDRQRPYHLGIFAGLNNATTSLNLILGLYNADSQTELLFDGLQFELLYSDATDVTPPTLIAQTATGTLLDVTATDNVAVERIIAVCDNGSGVWSSIYLAANGIDWQGNCPGDTVRAYAQVVDAAGNVTTTPWLDNLTAPPEIDFSVLISSSLEDVTLTWEPITEDNNGSPITVDHYEIWRSPQPYFLPAGSSPNPYASVSSTTTAYIDQDAWGTSSVQHYYQVRAIGAAGQLLVDSQQVGLIAMTLVSGE